LESVSISSAQARTQKLWKSIARELRNRKSAIASNLLAVAIERTVPTTTVLFRMRLLKFKGT
jgi:hypothetical protein